MAGHLLDGFLGLRERYAMLAPIIFDADLVNARGSGKRGRGLETLRRSLFLSCVQDVANLVADSDKRTPSLHNIMKALEDPHLVSELRARFAQWKLPSKEEETDPVLHDALRRLELSRQRELEVQFDDLVQELKSLHQELARSPEIECFRTIRDKLTAHLEIRLHEDGYRTVDVSELGLKWGDVGATLPKLQRAVELVGIVVRNASFAWDLLDENLETASSAFWAPS